MATLSVLPYSRHPFDIEGCRNDKLVFVCFIPIYILLLLRRVRRNAEKRDCCCLNDELASFYYFSDYRAVLSEKALKSEGEHV